MPEENEKLLRLLQEYKEKYRDSVQRNFYEEAGQNSPDLHSDRASDLLKKIHRHLGIEGLEERQRVKTAAVRRLYKGLAIAASVCLLVVSGYLLFRPHPEAGTVAGVKARPSQRTGDLPSPSMVRLANGADSIKTLHLEDGSTIQLAKNSALSFYRPFIHQRRDIYLEGGAVFSVVKDKIRPFTVYAGGIATKVLGTRFSVNAVDVGNVKVRLLEGKVAITAAAGSGLAMKDVVLKPGEELAFDKNSRSYTVNEISPREEKAAGHASPDKRPEMVFHKEPLGKVFQRIGVLYKVPLLFRQEELQGLYFTGTFLKSDDLHIVLSAICNVNNLAITEENDSIIITRSH